MFVAHQDQVLAGEHARKKCIIGRLPFRKLLRGAALPILGILMPILGLSQRFHEN